MRIIRPEDNKMAHVSRDAEFPVETNLYSDNV